MVTPALASRKPAPPLQLPASLGKIPQTRREMLAGKMLVAEREFHEAQRLLDGTNESHARYAKALDEKNQLEGMFQLIAAGLADETV